MLSLFKRKPKRNDGRPTTAEIEATILQRQQVVAGLTAHEIDLNLETLEAIFGQLEELDVGDRLVVISSDRQHVPLVFIHGERP